jgi:hypothetical protein
MFLNAISRKSSHRNGVIHSRLRKSTDGNVTVTHGLNLENPALQGNTIKRSINCLQKRKNLGRLSY